MGQYIGARYVPRFIGLYDNTQAYEALDVVDNGMGTSYIAKKPTPPNTPLTDTNYWFIYGASSGAIINLQNQINDMKDGTLPGSLQEQINSNDSDIAALNNEIDILSSPFSRKYVVITDSYGNYQNNDGRNFIEETFYKLGITDYYEFHRGSSGFAQAGNLNFLAVLQDNESAITDKTAITDIIVCGGANDQITPANIISGISTFVAYVKVNYPNAKIHIGNFTLSMDPSYITNLEITIAEYKRAETLGIKYIYNSQYIMRKMSFFISDNVHPTVAGIEALTKYLISYIIDGKIDVIERVGIDNTMLTSLEADYTISDIGMKMTQHNNIVTLECANGGIAFILSSASGFTVPAGITLQLDKFKLTDGFYYGPINYRTNLSGVYQQGGLVGNCAFVPSKISAGMASQFGIAFIADTTKSFIANTGIRMIMNTQQFSLDFSA